MTVKEFIEYLQEFSEDAIVNFYDWARADDMFMRDISESFEGDEIYINISR